MFDFLTKKRRRRKSVRRKGQARQAGARRGTARKAAQKNRLQRFFSEIFHNIRLYKKPGKKKRRRNRKTKPQGWKPRLIRILWAAAVLSPLLLLSTYWYLTHDLPDIYHLGTPQERPAISLRAHDGTVFATYGDLYGETVTVERLPKPLVQAVLATEDRRFYDHFGIDIFGLARAIYTNLRAGHVVQGGSTLTQQLAKILFLTPERSFKRKLQEAFLAVELERRYGKDEILSFYLNRVYLGAGCYGVDAASRLYFDKSAAQMDLPESAMLAGLLKAPTRYAPTRDLKKSHGRTRQVLRNMVAAGYLTQAEADAAEQHLPKPERYQHSEKARGSRYFAALVLEELPKLLGGEVKEDIMVTTTLDLPLQQKAEKAVAVVLDAAARKRLATQAALVSLTKEGGIRALVGGVDFDASQFNRATQAQRQPGSAFKLFVYLAGLEAGFSAGSTVEDQPFSVKKWQPKNHDHRYRGPVTLTEAFAQSINTVAVKISERVGRKKVIQMAERLGISETLPDHPSIALGTTEVTLLEMTGAYAHLPSEGGRVVPHAILRIQDRQGKTLYRRKEPETKQVVTRNIVHQMNRLLIEAVEEGTGKGARFGRPVAGKTGTSQDYRDAWFIGFTPQLTTGVWVGNDASQPMQKVSGGGYPARIWQHYMQAALAQAPVEPIPTRLEVQPSRMLPWQEGRGKQQDRKSFWQRFFDEF